MLAITTVLETFGMLYSKLKGRQKFRVFVTRTKTFVVDRHFRFLKSRYSLTFFDVFYLSVFWF